MQIYNFSLHYSWTNEPLNQCPIQFVVSSDFQNLGNLFDWITNRRGILVHVGMSSPSLVIVIFRLPTYSSHLLNSCAICWYILGPNSFTQYFFFFKKNLMEIRYFTWSHLWSTHKPQNVKRVYYSFCLCRRRK